MKSLNSENWYFNSKNGYLNISTWYLIMDTNISILKMLFEYEVWDLNFENYYLQSKSEISIKIYIISNQEFVFEIILFWYSKFWYFNLEFHIWILRNYIWIIKFFLEFQNAYLISENVYLICSSRRRRRRRIRRHGTIWKAKTHLLNGHRQTISERCKQREKGDFPSRERERALNVAGSGRNRGRRRFAREQQRSPWSSKRAVSSSHLFAVPISVLRVALGKSKQLNLDVKNIFCRITYWAPVGML